MAAASPGGIAISTAITLANVTPVIAIDPAIPIG